MAKKFRANIMPGFLHIKKWIAQHPLSKASREFRGMDLDVGLVYPLYEEINRPP